MKRNTARRDQGLKHRNLILSHNPGAVDISSLTSLPRVRGHIICQALEPNDFDHRKENNMARFKISNRFAASQMALTSARNGRSKPVPETKQGYFQRIEFDVAMI